MRHRISSQALAALLVLLTAAPAAMAKDTAVRPSITIEERYDSNVRYRGDDEDKDDDFITSASPRFDIAKKRERYALEASYDFEASYYAGNPDLNNISHEAAAAFTLDMTDRMRLDLSDRYDYTEDSLRTADTGILVARTGITANTASAGVARAIGERSEAALTLRNRIARYDSPDLVDSRTDSAEASYAYRYEQNGTARLTYRYADYKFDTGSDVASHGVSLGIIEDVAPTLTADFSAGVAYTPGLDGDDYFLTAAAGLEKVYRNSVFSVAYTREVTDPTGLADEINLSDRVSFGIEQTFSRGLTASLTGGLAKNRTEPNGTVDLNSYNIDLAGGWQAKKWMLLGAGLSYYNQWDGDTFDTGSTRNIAYINVTFTGNEWRF